MHPELIKAHIRMKGTTPTAVADDLQVTSTAVTNVITGKSKSARIRAHIANLIGKKEGDIWPEGAKPYPGLRRRPVPPRDKDGWPIGAVPLGGSR